MRKYMGQTGETHGGNSDRCNIKNHQSLEEPKVSIATFVSAALEL